MKYHFAYPYCVSNKVIYTIKKWKWHIHRIECFAKIKIRFSKSIFNHRKISRIKYEKKRIYTRTHFDTKMPH